MPQITSKRPYLIRAMHEWMTDNGLTPFVVVDADSDGLQVPDSCATDGRLVLNVSYTATRGLTIADDGMRFEARFGGISQRVDVPISGIIGIYAQETGQGMIFSDDDSSPPGSGKPGDSDPPGRPTLRVVK